MTASASLSSLRQRIREFTLADETELGRHLLQVADIGEAPRERAQNAAREFVANARANAARSGLIDKFLQEYGLSTAEGVTLMRLAEALLRTPDAATADALIEDKIEAGDWSSHKGKSPFPLINFSTRALMFTAAWIDDVEAKDPARKILAATKSLLDRIGEPTIRLAVGQAMRVMGEHFVLGENIEEASRRGRTFAEKGYLFSYDMLGEAALTARDAEKFFNDYSSAIAAIAENAANEDPRDNPGISVKLSALHPRYEYGQKDRVRTELGERLRDLAIAAKTANIGFNIDAEETDRLDLSLDLIESLMRDDALAGWDGFGVVVQAYQRRALPVLSWLAQLARDVDRRIMVRLVKGAYWDAEIKRAQVMGLSTYPVFTRKALTDVSFVACARKLLENADVIYPQFATHNALTATTVREMAGDDTEYELQRLHGMGEALHDRLIADGARSRIYAPVGGHRELLPYLVRRLLENGANSSFVNQLIDPDLSVDAVVADPIDESSALDRFPNPSIPAPRDLFHGARLSAEGWDETDPHTADALERAARQPLELQEDGGDMRIANPARHEDVIGSVNSASTSDVERACMIAEAATQDWSARTDRSEILNRAATLIEQRAENFFALACREAGKTLPDAIAEMREAVDFLRFYADEAQRLTRAPIGVVACISPWNFPLAIFLGQVSAALAAGNTVVAKPAEQTPLIAKAAVNALYEAGIPKEALHLVCGDGPNVGAPLVSDPRIGGVVFTGSTPTAKRIHRALCQADKPDAVFVAETGGVNAMIIDSTALLEQAVGDVVDSAFQSAGQRCSACRLVCVQDDIADKFEEMLAGAIAELRVGDPALLSTDVGPVIDRDAHAAIAAHIDQMESRARLIARAPATPAQEDGAFIAPVAFALKEIDDLKSEIFGPVLHVARFSASALDELVDRINALGFGLTLGAHTRIDATMERIAARARVGNIYINRNQIGAVVGVQPFGGEGLSGTGPKAGGPHYVSALTKKQARPTNAAPLIDEVDVALDGELDAALDEACNRYASWSNDRNKATLFQNAAETSTGPLRAHFTNAARQFRDHFAEAIDLPGPTGESNTLKLRGRGVILCVGDALYEHALVCLAAGNAVVLPAEAANALRAAMPKALAPLIIGADAAGPEAVRLKLIQDPRIVGIAGDLAEPTKSAFARTVAERDGAIVPLLTLADAPSRFAAERTLTINTTAAGGDVRLLSLPE